VDLAFENVGLPQELRQSNVARPAVQGRRGVELCNDAMAQHGHLIGHRQCLVLVVGDQNGGGSGLAQDREDIGSDRGPHGRVERGEGLVQEDDLGTDGERPGQGDPLLLAAGELVRIAAAVPGQAHQLEELVDLAPAIRTPGKTEGHIAANAQVREERALLGHVADPPPFAGHEMTPRIVDEVIPDPDLPAVGPLEAGHNPQQRGLPTARGPENGRERTGRNGELHPAQDRLGPERLGHAGDAKVLHDDTILVCRRVPGLAQRALAGGSHPSRLAVEPTTEHIARHGRNEHHDGCIGGRLVVRHVRLVGPELGGQRLHIGGMQGPVWR
jgi:hypothetical protein